MLHRVSELIGHHLEARDGAIGKIKDLFFDDEAWTVRYLVADTGRWLSSRRVLLSPFAVITAAMDAKRLPVNLTKAQIENSPDIEADLPVSEQHQRDLHAYYGWAPYWGVGPYAIAGVGVPPPLVTVTEDERPVGDPHLRAVKEVKGYKIHALDGTIGHVDDFIVDADNWNIRLLVVDTRNWLPGRKVVIIPGAVNRVSWTNSEVTVRLTRDEIKECPEYSATAPLGGDYGERLAHFSESTFNLSR